jgi:hypothetical protein
MYLKLKPNLVLSLEKNLKWERGNEREEETFKNGHGCERGRESEKVKVPGDPDETRARPTGACGARTYAPRVRPP